MGFRCDRILAGTALALVLSLSPQLHAAPADEKAVEAAVPAPQPADLPSPAATSAQSAPAAATEPSTAAAPAEPAKPETAAAPQPDKPQSTPTETAAKPDSKTEPVKADTAATPDIKVEPAKADTAAKPDSKPESANTETAAKPVEQIDPAVLKTLTGKDLVKAPVAASLTTADQPIAEKLRELLATKSDRFFSRKAERQTAEAFYRDRGFAPLWIEKGALSARASAANAYLRGVDADGLDPSDYPAIDAKNAEPDALAEAELRYTATLFTYARHAQTGQVHYTRVSGDILYPLDTPDPADILANISGTEPVGEALASYNPPHAGYKALKAKLAELRSKPGETAPARIEDGPVLKIGKDKRGKEITMEDPRVPLLRARLGVVGDADDKTYDKALAEAVKKFQEKHGLKATGQFNTATLNALNGPRRDRDAEIILANLERWRWLPHDLGKAYVMLNIPDFTLKVVNDNKTVWATRVVTGKPGRMATPMLTETMKYITVNPTWNVPPSIINNEYLPALEQDPDALNRIGLKLTQNPDGTIRIYQPPGEGNALGRIRFNFPNKFLVYQHDTPDKNLFAHERRAYSHGCMRVQFPDKYAEVLLNLSQPKDGWTAERIRKLYGGAEQNITLAHPIPVHITYQTAFVDDAGHLQIREDIYGRDGALLALLKSDRKGLDTPIERREVSEKPPVARLPVRSESPFANWFRRDDSYMSRSGSEMRDARRGGGRYPTQSEPSFFERIFR